MKLWLSKRNAAPLWRLRARKGLLRRRQGYRRWLAEPFPSSWGPVTSRRGCVRHRAPGRFFALTFSWMLRHCEQQQKRQHREQRAGTAGDVGSTAGQEAHGGQDPGLGRTGSRDAGGGSRALCCSQTRCTPFLSALVSSSRQETQAWRCWGNSLDLELGGGSRGRFRGAGQQH